MAEEKTLLLEKETEIVVQSKPVQEVKKEVIEKKEKEIAKEIFSKPLSEDVAVEKPNFDTLPSLSEEKRKKIFKVEREKVSEKKHSNKRLKILIVSIIFMLLSAFTITTGVEIAKANAQLQVAQSEYSANLLQLMQKIYSTETGNRSLSLFETFPEEDLTATSIYETSNWFDRFCKFLTGLFGG